LGLTQNISDNYVFTVNSRVNDVFELNFTIDDDVKLTHCTSQKQESNFHIINQFPDETKLLRKTPFALYKATTNVESDVNA